MSIAIVAPTGKVASALTCRLIDLGADLTLLARHPEKVKEQAACGANVQEGSMEDEDFVVDATQHAEALFWMTPPKFDVDDHRAYQRRLGRIGAAAIRANNIPFVVNLSSIGAQHPTGVGPISGLHDIEEELNKSAKNIIHLRCGMFFENHLMALESAQDLGQIYAPAPADVAIPQVATRDIAVIAADLLLHRDWRGINYREIHGPANLSYNDLARGFSEVLGKKVEYVRVSPEVVFDRLLSMGFSRNLAEDYLEMYDGAAKGLIMPLEPRSAENTTQTTFTEFLRAYLQKGKQATTRPPSAPKKRSKHRAA